VREVLSGRGLKRKLLLYPREPTRDASGFWNLPGCARPERGAKPLSKCVICQYRPGGQGEGGAQWAWT